MGLAFEAFALYGMTIDDRQCWSAGRNPGRGGSFFKCHFINHSRLRQAIGLSAVNGSVGLTIEDGLIHSVGIPWLSTQFPPLPAEFGGFVEWLQVRHPGAIGLLPDREGTVFRTVGQAWVLHLNRRSLDLLAEYLEEYEASVTIGT